MAAKPFESGTDVTQWTWIEWTIIGVSALLIIIFVTLIVRGGHRRRRNRAETKRAAQAERNRYQAIAERIAEQNARPGVYKDQASDASLLSNYAAIPSDIQMRQYVDSDARPAPHMAVTQRSPMLPVRDAPIARIPLMSINQRPQNDSAYETVPLV